MLPKGNWQRESKRAGQARVWESGFLEYDLEDRARYELRMGAPLLNNCLNMDERCKIIEDSRRNLLF